MPTLGTLPVWLLSVVLYVWVSALDGTDFMVTTVAGTGEVTPYSVFLPGGLAYDEDTGAVYVSSLGVEQIVRFNHDGSTTMVAQGAIATGTATNYNGVSSLNSTYDQLIAIRLDKNKDLVLLDVWDLRIIYMHTLTVDQLPLPNANDTTDVSDVYVAADNTLYIAKRSGQLLQVASDRRHTLELAPAVGFEGYTAPYTLCGGGGGADGGPNGAQPLLFVVHTAVGANTTHFDVAVWTVTSPGEDGEGGGGGVLLHTVRLSLQSQYVVFNNLATCAWVPELTLGYRSFVDNTGWGVLLFGYCGSLHVLPLAAAIQASAGARIDLMSVDDGTHHRLLGPQSGFADGTTPLAMAGSIVNMVVVHEPFENTGPAMINGVPVEVVTTRPSSLMFTDFDNNRVRSFDFATGVLSTLYGRPIDNYAGDGVAAVTPLTPGNVVAVNDSVYVIDSGNSLLRVIKGGVLTSIAGVPSRVFSNNAVFQDVDQWLPVGTTPFSGQDLAVHPRTGLIVYIDGQGYMRVIVDGLTRRMGLFREVQSPGVHAPWLVFDPFGALYIVFAFNISLVTFHLPAPACALTCVVGCQPTFSDDKHLESAATVATLDFSPALTCDARGRLFIAETQTIRKVEAGVISFVAYHCATYVTGFVVHMPAPTPNGLDGPAGAGDAGDTSYRFLLTDSSSQEIVMVDVATQSCVAVAGTEGVFGFNGDGPGLGVQLALPVGLARDAAGTLYVSDVWNGRVRALALRSAGAETTSSALPLWIWITIGSSIVFGLTALYTTYRLAKARRRLRQLVLRRGLYQVKPLTRMTFKQTHVTPIELREVRILESVGKGSSSEVFRALWHGGTVAIKRLHDKPSERAHILPPTQAEAENEIILNGYIGNHPCVVPFLGGSFGAKCLVFNFMDFGSMEKLLVHDQMYPVGIDITGAELVQNWIVLSQMMMDAAAGIFHCHTKCIIHRDIASRNFLVDKLNRVSVCDLGLARFLPPGEPQGQSPAGETMALAWCAPEVLRESIVSEKTDVYSFGVFMYEVVARVEPFPGMRPHEAALGVASAALRPSIPEFCPVELSQLMGTCWAELPINRPDMQTVCDKLFAFHHSYQVALSDFKKDQDVEALLKVFHPLGPPPASLLSIAVSGNHTPSNRTMVTALPANLLSTISGGSDKSDRSDKSDKSSSSSSSSSGGVGAATIGAGNLLPLSSQATRVSQARSIADSERYGVFKPTRATEIEEFSPSDNGGGFLSLRRKKTQDDNYVQLVER